MKHNTDIDIDVIDRDIVLENLHHIKASINKNGVYTKHIAVFMYMIYHLTHRLICPV